MKKVAIIGTVGVPACYGGFETLAEYLVTNLAEQFDLTVYCSYGAYKEHPSQWKGAKLKYIHCNANGLSCLLYDTLNALDAVFYADVLLLLGGNAIFILMFLKLLGIRKKIVANVDGMESTREKFNPLLRKYCSWMEWLTVHNSDVIIADNKAIADHLIESYGSGRDYRIIEYGADHCQKVAITADDIEKYSFLKDKYSFSVCRIERENNVHVTLEAYSQMPGQVLVIVGNWNKSEFSRELREKYSGFANIHLLDPIYERRTIDMLRGNCSIYIHGHHCGGTNPSLVEAMHLARSIFAFDVDYNRETTENKAKYYNSVETLQALVRNTSEQELKQVSEDMAEISERRYTWMRISKLYAECF